MTGGQEEEESSGSIRRVERSGGLMRPKEGQWKDSRPPRRQAFPGVAL